MFSVFVTELCCAANPSLWGILTHSVVLELSNHAIFCVLEVSKHANFFCAGNLKLGQLLCAGNLKQCQLLCGSGLPP
jgi:hypothetical protein